MKRCEREFWVGKRPSERLLQGGPVGRHGEGAQGAGRSRAAVGRLAQRAALARPASVRAPLLVRVRQLAPRRGGAGRARAAEGGAVKRAKQAGGRYGYRSFSNHLLLPPLFMLHLRASRCPASSHPIPKSNPRCATPQALLFLSSELNRNLCLPGRPCRAWRAYEYGRGPCRSKPRDSPSTALPD